MASIQTILKLEEKTKIIVHVLTPFYLNEKQPKPEEIWLFYWLFFEKINQTLHYDSLHAFGFKETACLQFEKKLQFKHFYAELLENDSSLKLNAFADIRRDVKISALAQI